MKHILKIILATSLLYSCNFFGPVESSIQTNDVVYSEKDIIGTWKLDKFSYEYLSKKESIDSIYITFNEDSTFVMNNSIKLFNRTAYLSENQKMNGVLDNQKCKGNWKVTYIKAANIYVFDLIDNKTFISDFKVYKKGDEYQIWYFLNDPDTGQRLRFLKD